MYLVAKNKIWGYSEDQLNAMKRVYANKQYDA